MIRRRRTTAAGRARRDRITGLLLAAMAACGQEGSDRLPDTDTVPLAEPGPAAVGGSPEILPPGQWAIAARLGEGTILARLPDRGPGARIAPRAEPPSSPAAPELLIHSPAAGIRGVEADVIPLTLPGIDSNLARPLALARVTLAGEDHYFGLPAAGPALLTSLANPRLAIFEEANALWTLDADGGARRLTAPRVGEYDYQALAARQREGEVILYWASAPVWSPDGVYVAYATNRESVALGEPGQSIWLLDVERAGERQLLREAGRSFRPVAWLGAEIVYIGDAPGVWAVDPATGARRRLGMGVLLDGVGDGSAIAIAEKVPDEPAVRILSPGGPPASVPFPGPGTTFAAQAAFSPDGRRLLLQASAEGGTVRRFLIFDRQAGRLSSLDLPDATPGEWPAWVDNERLLINSRRSDTGESRASIVRVP